MLFEYRSNELIDNYCNRYGFQRNKIIHQHSILDEDLRHIELMLNVSRQQDSEYKIFASSEYRVLIKEFVKKKVPEINDFLSNILDKIVVLLDSLEPIYKTKKNSLVVKNH